MYSTLGIHWAASLLGFLALALTPVPWVLFQFGPKIRARSKYDTQGLEASYLAAGQAERAEELAATITALNAAPFPPFTAKDPITEGALVETSLGGNPEWFLLAPCAGGLTVELKGREITVLGPGAPLRRELQGLKKGIVELADMIAVNKADGDNVERAKRAAADYRAALNILAPQSANWAPPVVTYSALTGNGIAELWEHVLAHNRKMTASGELARRRSEQQVKWMRTMLEDRLATRLRSDASVRSRLRQMETQVAAGKLAPTLAVEEIAKLLGV